MKKYSASALQEREERSKGCIYCEQAASITSGFLCNACVSKLKGFSGNVTYALCVNSTEYQKINYCPMCGRKLRGN